MGKNRVSLPVITWICTCEDYQKIEILGLVMMAAKKLRGLHLFA